MNGKENTEGGGVPGLGDVGEIVADDGPEGLRDEGVVVILRRQSPTGHSG